jgi:hypothetical protein
VAHIPTAIGCNHTDQDSIIELIFREIIASMLITSLIAAKSQNAWQKVFSTQLSIQQNKYRSNRLTIQACVHAKSAKYAPVLNGELP